MELVKKTDEYEIVKKRSGRYGVRNADRKWVNGDDKVRILAAEKLIKVSPPKKKPEPEPEPKAEAVAEQAPVEEEPAEEAPAAEQEATEDEAKE